MSYGAWLPQIKLAICLRVLHFNHGFNATNTDLVGKLQGILRDLKKIKQLEDRTEYTYGQVPCTQLSCMSQFVRTQDA